MAYGVLFTAGTKSGTHFAEEMDITDANALVGSWIFAGYDVSVFYVDGREPDDFDSVAVAHLSTLNNTPGWLYGAVWCREHE